jgi:ATP-binding cassette subfamily B protein
MIIAHRMRTVLEADNIVVLKDGEIKEIGSPSELRSKNGIFNSMVEKQYMS